MKIIRIDRPPPPGGTDSPDDGGVAAAPFLLPRRCITCKELKPPDSFYRSSARADGLSAFCKECSKIKSAAGHQKRLSKYTGPKVETKTCIQCSQELDAQLFYSNRASPDGLSPQCRACNSQNCKTYRTKNKSSYKARQQRTYKALRTEALEAYGHKCACCGEVRYNFLAIDHTNGGGREQLRRDGIQRSDLTRWLRDNNYPQDDFRCLCHSCNTSLGMYGYCPHGGVGPTATVLYLPIKGTLAAKRRFNYKQRRLTLEAYGGKCTCCDENVFEFLAFDHINGGGTKHRGVIGPSIVDYLYRNGFPKDFQILCHSCNLSRGYYGYCHEDPPTDFNHH